MIKCFNKLNLTILMIACCSSSHSLDIELRLDAYFHTFDRFKKVYASATASGGIELSETFFFPEFEVWGSFDYFAKHSSGQCCKTKIEAPTISFGVKHSCMLFDFLKLYMGIGPSFSHVIVKNRSCFEKERIIKDSCGVVFKTGTKISVSPRTYINLFADYVYQPVNYQKTVDIGGLKLGVGLGASF